MNKKGYCLCRSVTFEYEGDELWRGHCHCESCRRQTASPLTTFMGVKNGAWSWTGKKPNVFSSSKGVRRYFCAGCGCPVAYESDRYPDEIHFYASLLDDHSAFQVGRHYHWDERVPWVSLNDELPKD